MRRTRGRTRLVGAALLGAVLVVTATASASTYVRNISSGGTTAIRGGAPGSPTFASPELPGPKGGEEATSGRLAAKPAQTSFTINRRLSTGVGQGAAVRNTARTATTAGQVLSFRGLNHYDTRTANNGNQFSGEPPDQGLCAGNGYVLETVNSVLQVYNTAGKPLSNPTSLNEFYKYPPAINRTTGVFGPDVFDPSCHYDRATNRWFHVAATLEQDRTSGDFTGQGWIDLAVSKTGNPLGSWTRYRIWTTNDGRHGQPNHHCQDGPCFGDYPHIGADANGFYIPTNEYSFFADQYTSAQIYAFSKAQLAAGAANPRMVHIDNTHVAGGPGFTVWPAISTGNEDTRGNGTEWFLSSNAAAEANGTGASNQIAVWGLSNTASLNSPAPHLVLRTDVVGVDRYSMPPSSQQKAGPTPLRTCLNNTQLPTPFGKGCWQWFFVDEPAHDETMYRLDSNDTRMQQVTYAAGKLWGALDTAVGQPGSRRAGIAYYIVRPTLSDGHVQGSLVKQGHVAVAGANLTYPAIGVLPNGEGAMAFTLVGRDDYPSAAWAPIDVHSVGSVRIAGHGVGPDDGFSGYKAFGDPPRPRWGDYGAAAVSNGTIWLGSEYIAQRCSFTRYVTDAPNSPMFTCGNARTSLANWATRITAVRP
jgi:hypothetical protein